MIAFRRSLPPMFRSVARDKRGNVAMIWALAAFAMLSMVGLSIDYARAGIARTALQNAVDAAALAVGAKPALTPAQRQAMAETYLRANFTLDASMGTPATPTVTVDGESVTVSSFLNVPTTVGALLGARLSPTASSRVVWGQTKLWVSLALDNTGSMAGAKLTSLKTATHQLLDLLEGVATQPDDVKVAFMPFSKTVNAGPDKFNEPWIDWTDWESFPANYNVLPSGRLWEDYGPQGKHKTCPWTTSRNGFKCMTAALNGSAQYSDSNQIPTGLFCPSVDNGSKNAGRSARHYNGCFTSVKRAPLTCTSNCKYDHVWTPNPRATWTGCIMDRNQSYDVEKTSPTSTATRFPAENGGSCVPSVMLGSLSNNWSALHDKTDDMTVAGNTNQTIGLAWAMMAQTPGAPFNAPSLPEFTTRYIILFSDGQNTQNRWSSSQSAVDARMTLACQNAKTAGFVIYSVYIDTGGAGNSPVMQACASDSSKYYALTTEGAIVTAFNQIGQEITKLRVAH